MSSHVLEPSAIRRRAPRVLERLVVTRRSIDMRYTPLGFLEAHEGRYEFSYLRSAVAQPDFVPLPGFSNPHLRYRESYLFPLFAERVMSPRRPDRSRYLRALDLHPDADAMEVLARSGGRRHGDTIELFRAPERDEHGQVRSEFLVHGVRHMEPDPTEEIAGLQRGEALLLQAEPENSYNPQAILVLSVRGVRLGYVPNPLAGFISDLQRFGAPRVQVEVANGSDVVPHLRLLVSVAADVPTGYEPLSGWEWEPVA